MEDIIIKYLNDEASNEDKQAILEWLRLDNANKEIFHELRQAWLSAAGLAKRDEESKSAFLLFKENIIKTYDKKPVPLRPNIKWIAIASILFLFLSIGTFFLGRRSITSAPQPQMYTVVMGKGSKGPVVLPDSSIVWLNSNSRLTYPEKFSSETRAVKLEGEGYFDVKRDESKPFIVEAGNANINVLGTQFVVKRYTDNEVLETTLISGSVEVELETINKRTILKPNQRLLFNNKTNTVFTGAVAAKEQILWINSQLEFSNERLSDVLRKLGIWYGVEIIASPEVNLNQRLSFVVKKESEEEIFKLLSLITPIKYTIEQNKIIINPNN